MVRHAIGPMILAASILAVPVLAATQSSDPAGGNPVASDHGAMAPTNNMGAGMTGTRPDQAAPAAGTAANVPSTPLYTTADGQIRVGKIVGAGVYNDQNQSVGSIDDVLMSHNNKATAAIISVGGFLGMGSKLVSVPFNQLKIESNRIVMPGATQASLKSMPSYKYNNA
jgi:hypothetical protein